MKTYIFSNFTKLSVFFAVISLASCGGDASSSATPTDPLAIKNLIAEKKQAITLLEAEIADLKEKLKTLQPERTQDARGVTTVIAKPELFERFIDFQALVVADETVNASSEMGGRILKLSVKEGQQVRKGQVIAQVDMETVEKQIEEINTGLELANTVFERQARLWEQKIGSEIQYLQAKNNKERLEKSLSTAKSTLAKRFIYSPINGVVDREFLKEGELASPGMPIVSILNTQKVKVVADIPESYLGKVKVGDLLEISFPALGKSVTRKVSLLGRTIDAANRTFTVEIATDNLNGALKPNLLASVKVKDLSIKDVVSIPLELIQEDVDGSKFVYLVNKEAGVNKASKIFIEIGETAAGKAIVTKGIKPNDEYVVLGSRNIIDGDLLTIEGAPAIDTTKTSK